MNSKQKKTARRREETLGRRFLLARTRSAVASTSAHRILSPTAIASSGPVQNTFLNTIQSVAPIPQFPKFNFPARTSNETVEQEMLDSGALTGADLDIQGQFSGMFPNMGPNIHDPRQLLAYVNHHEVLNAATARGAVPLTSNAAFASPQKSPEEARLEREFCKAYEEALSGNSSNPMETEADIRNMNAEMERQAHYDEENDGNSSDEEMDFWRFDYKGDDTEEPEEPDEDMVSEDEPDGDEEDCVSDEMDEDEDYEDRVAFMVSVDSEDSPDPFAPEDHKTASDLPPHILSIYCLVTWLHAQFHLPRAACNAVLACLAFLVFALAPQLQIPYITLKSANNAIGLTDVPIHILAVCPDCRDVFPGTSQAPDKCTNCTCDLFSNVTIRGNIRKDRVPLVKYPYLSISEQLSSILSIPGVGETMDDWRKVKRTPGHYQDIFDGRIAKNIRGHDGKLFFSNNPNEINGPNGELRLGLNWGIDW